MAPQIENIDDRKLEYAPGRKIRVRRFVPLTNDDYIVDDGSGRKDYTMFTRSTSAGITDSPLAFYPGAGRGLTLSFNQGQNLYVRNAANTEVVVVNIL